MHSVPVIAIKEFVAVWIILAFSSHIPSTDAIGEQATQRPGLEALVDSELEWLEVRCCMHPRFHAAACTMAIVFMHTWPFACLHSSRRSSALQLPEFWTLSCQVTSELLH